MQAPFPLFGALNVPYRIIELLHTNRHRELLRLNYRFDSYTGRSAKNAQLLAEMRMVGRFLIVINTIFNEEVV